MFSQSIRKGLGGNRKVNWLLVCHSDKRMNALEKATEYLDMIYEKMQQAEKYKRIISKAYEEAE